MRKSFQLHCMTAVVDVVLGRWVLRRACKCIAMSLVMPGLRQYESHDRRNVAINQPLAPLLFACAETAAALAASVAALTAELEAALAAAQAEGEQAAAAGRAAVGELKEARSSAAALAKQVRR